MAKKKLTTVTVSIPTYNSGSFLTRCLTALKNQTYKKIEINIIDGGSTDNTVEIAKNFKAKILTVKGSLMRSRFEGVKIANGDYVLLLDSDQILSKNAIEKCIKKIEENNLDMLILEEDVWRKETVLENLFHLDRKLVHSVKDYSPYTSVLLPRFFKKDLLLSAYNKVPKKVIDYAMPQDHAILYLEAWKLSKKIGMVNNAVKHIEPGSVMLLSKKFFRWGFYSKATIKTPYDAYFHKRTERFRKGMFQKGLYKESMASIALLLIKGIPYKSGYFARKIVNIRRSN